MNRKFYLTISANLLIHLRKRNTLVHDREWNSIRTFIKAMYILVGIVFLGIGALGVVLPLLPSIPFLFIASVCFVKGSERLDRWFKGTTLYQKHLLGFLKNKEMTLGQKIWINIVADSAIIMSIFIVDVVWVKVILVLAALYKHYYFIFKIKTIQAVS